MQSPQTIAAPRPVPRWPSLKPGGGAAASGGWLLASSLLLSVPLLLAPVLPATDLPQHLGIAAVVWRLLHGDPATAVHYALNLQPVPYHLIYLGLVPAVGLLGPDEAARAVLIFLALATEMALALCLRARRADPAWLLGGVFVFYGPLFYWGFIATMAGLPGLLLLLWALLRLSSGVQTGRWWVLVVGALGAALATCAHAILAWPAWLLALGWRTESPAQVLAETQLGGQADAAAGQGSDSDVPLRPVRLLLASAAGLPLLPAILLALGARVAELAVRTGTASVNASADLRITWASPALQGRYLLGFLGPIDHGLGRASHLAFLLLLLAAGLAPSRRRRAGLWKRLRQLPLALPLVLLGLSFALCPRFVHRGESEAWGIGFRFLCVAEALALVAWAPVRGAGRQQRRQRLLLIACVGLYAVAQVRVWHRFAQAAAPTLAAALAAAAPLPAAVPGVERLAGIWPPVLRHLGLYRLAWRGPCDDRVFAGGHLPIRRRAACGPPP